MERKQGFMFRCVDIVMELFAMTATVARTRQMIDDRDPDATKALEMANLFCSMSRRKVRRLFRDLWSNSDTLKNKVAASVMQGSELWLEKGALDTGLTKASFKTVALTELRAKEQEKRQAGVS